MNAIAAFPEVLLKEVQSYLKDHVDWKASRDSEGVSHPEQQIHLKLDVTEFRQDKKIISGEERSLAADLSSEELNEFVAWFLSSSPAKSLTWEFDTDIIDHIPNAYDLLGRFERLSILYMSDMYTTIDLSRLPENNRVRVLTLNNVEFVVFGCLNNLTNLRELHVVNCWKLDLFLGPSSFYFDENYKFKDGKSHPFAEFEFPGLEKASFRMCSSDLPFNPRKFSHVRDVTFHVCKCLPYLSSLKNLSSFVYTGGSLGGSEFDKMLSYSSPLKRFDVGGLEFTSQKILEVGLNRQIRHLALHVTFLTLFKGLKSHFLVHDNLESLELSLVPTLPTTSNDYNNSIVQKKGDEDCGPQRAFELVTQSMIVKLEEKESLLVDACPGFTDCSQVSGVKDLTVNRCEGLVTLVDRLKCQSLTLIQMDYLSSLKEVRDIPELYIRWLRSNHLLYELGGIGNQKMEFTYIKIPDDLPYLTEYLKFERWEYNEYAEWKEKISITVFLRKL
eukprot:gene12283-13435_t